MDSRATFIVTRWGSALKGDTRARALLVETLVVGGCWLGCWVGGWVGGRCGLCWVAGCWLLVVGCCFAVGCCWGCWWVAVVIDGFGCLGLGLGC